MIPKIRILYTTPRSGSTFLAGCLAEHFEKVEGRIYLGEFFNVNFTGFSKVDGKVVLDENFKWPKLKDSLSGSVNFFSKKQSEKIKLLLNSNGCYFAKLFPRMMPDKIENWLFSNSHVIFSERRNLYEQVQSFLLAKASDRWHGNDFDGSKDAQYKVEWVEFVKFCRFIHFYKTKKMLLRPSQEIVYENVVKKKVVQFEKTKVKIEGLSGKYLREKVRLSKKRDLILNLDELNAWYVASPLQHYFPISYE